ncbi:uncharacterized protein LOC119167626 isoform X2 [Rhipicephalus microplus]|uniref:uncharacterized protein LOC119167626 isoform X2 n=1 Tax=Rhipicephalus microplus TaxID=6941 RepID=UPI003F6D240A
MPSSADRLHPYVTGLATSCCSGSLKCQFQSCPIAAVLNTSKASSPRPFTISRLATKNSVNLGAKGLNATGL